MKKLFFLLLAVLSLIGCDAPRKYAQENKVLPVLGRPEVRTEVINGKEDTDTIPHKIKSFSFINQEMDTVDNTTFKDKIYVADFFFTTCPSICPIMKKQLLRVYEKYKENKEVAIVSHTIDPGHDSPEVLKSYAERLGVSLPQWYFLTGDLFKIYDIAETSYMVYAEEDEQAPGGFAHSGALILVDKAGQVRGVYDGTEEEQVTLLMEDMDILLESYE